jgi:hypothetical protein
MEGTLCVSIALYATVDDPTPREGNYIGITLAALALGHKAAQKREGVCSRVGPLLRNVKPQIAIQSHAVTKHRVNTLRSRKDGERLRICQEMERDRMIQPFFMFTFLRSGIKLLSAVLWLAKVAFRFRHAALNIEM